MLPFAHVMLDLETLGQRPGAVIVSIGAWAFNVEDPQNGVPFYMRINPQSCIDVGLRMDPSTVLWWLQQNDVARREFAGLEEAFALQKVLLQFGEWMANWNRIGQHGPRVWGNGATFDNVLLTSAYAACKMQTPWSYHADRCYRTLRALYPDVDLPPATGIQHHALEDAKWQALHLAAIFQAKGLK